MVGDSAHSVFWAWCGLAEVPPEDDWLGPREAQILAGLRYPKRRAEWRLGRWVAKQALRGASEQLGLPSLTGASCSGLEILPAADGAPEVSWVDGPLPLRISLSHREGQGICAVGLGRLALGCDLEYVEPRSAAFVGDYFTDAERRQIESAGQQRDLVVATLWSAKESALKALRVGLRRSTRSVEVSLSNVGRMRVGNDDWRPVAVSDRELSRRFEGWWQPVGEHVVTMVAEPDLARPQLIDG